jgi:hypothetical protein
VDTASAIATGSLEVVALPGVRTGRAGVLVLQVIDCVVVSLIGLQKITSAPSHHEDANRVSIRLVGADSVILSAVFKHNADAIAIGCIRYQRVAGAALYVNAKSMANS